MAVKEKKSIEITEATTNEKIEKMTDNEKYCIYIGPSIGAIQEGTIYPKTLKETKAFLKADIEKYPLIERLIVTDKTISEDRIKVKTPGNLLYEYYRKLAGK